MTISDIETRVGVLRKELDRDITPERVKEIRTEFDDLVEKKKAILKGIEQREKQLAEVRATGTIVPRPGIEYDDSRSINKMDNNTNTELEVRAFQKYLCRQRLDDYESRALNVAGTAAVIPASVSNNLITSEAYSDLLYRATVINEPGAGKISIPIASNTAASWKIENTTIQTGTTTYEAAPTITNLELGGYELYRWLRISAASYSLSTGDFETMLLTLLSSEVIETLEDGFVTGTGTAQPKGLDNLTWTTGTNQKLTASSSTAISAAVLAEGLSMLKQKYARNAIIMCNASTLFDISQFKGTSEYAFNMTDGATKFMGKDIVVNEHVSDDVIYIVDPSQLYVRFAMPIAVEANSGSGFTAAAIDLRALTVVDAAWNPAACVRVGLGA